MPCTSHGKYGGCTESSKHFDPVPHSEMEQVSTPYQEAYYNLVGSDYEVEQFPLLFIDKLDPLKDPKYIVIHWTGGSINASAKSIGADFNQLYIEKKKTLSTHFGVSNKSIAQFLPFDKAGQHVGLMSGASESYQKAAKLWNYAWNYNTIGIETTPGMPTGEFSPDTKDRLKFLIKYIKDQFPGKKLEIIRHFDVTRKNCPQFYSPQDITQGTIDWLGKPITYGDPNGERNWKELLSQIS